MFVGEDAACLVQIQAGVPLDEHLSEALVDQAGEEVFKRALGEQPAAGFEKVEGFLFAHRQQVEAGFDAWRAFSAESLRGDAGNLHHGDAGKAVFGEQDFARFGAAELTVDEQIDCAGIFDALERTGIFGIGFELNQRGEAGRELMAAGFKKVIAG